MEDSFNIPQGKFRNNWMVDEEDNLESMASFFEEELEPSCNSTSSSFSDEDGDATSSNSSSSTTNDKFEQGSSPFEMSSLLAQLPIKRGLSKHFQGKSQSFTSLSSVRCLEDLIKPEKLYKKELLKLKPSKSSNTIAKRSSRSSFSTLGSRRRMRRRRSFLSSSTSMAPQRQGSSVSNQTLLDLFA